MTRQNLLWRVLFLALPLALYSLIVIWPLLDSFRYSVTNWNGFSPDYKFIGVANFAKIFSDPLFANAIKNTALWMLAAVIIPTGLGLALALLLNQRMAGSGFFKTLFYLPICLAAAVPVDRPR